MVSKIFLNRVTHELKADWKVFRSIVDWTIALYFIIPGIIFGGMYYHEVWTTSPKWLNYVSPTMLLLLIFIFLFIGEVRTYLEEADLLFLANNPKIIRGLMKRGFLFSLFIANSKLIAIFLLLLPIFLKGLEFSLFDCIFLYCYSMVFKAFLLVLNRYIQYVFNKWWKKYVVKLVNFIVMSIVYIVGFQSLSQSFILIAIICISLYFILKRMSEYKKYFYREIGLEQIQKWKFTNFALENSGNRTKARFNHKPWLLKNSKKLFKKDQQNLRIIESFVKTYFRNWTNVVFYFQLTFICAAGIITTPLIVKLIILPFGLFATFHQSKGDWEYFKNGMILKVYFNEDKTYTLSQKARFVLVIPSFIILFLAVIIACLTILI